MVCLVQLFQLLEILQTKTFRMLKFGFGTELSFNLEANLV